MKIRSILSLVICSLLLIACVLVLALTGVIKGAVECVMRLDEATNHFALVRDLLSGELDLFGGIGGGGGGSPYEPSGPTAPGDADFEQTLLAALDARKDVVTVSQFSLTDAELREQMSFFFFTHPEVFYVSTGYQIGTLKGSDRVEQVRLSYLYDKAEIPAMIETYESRVDEIVQGVPAGADEFATVLYLHDYIVKNFSYDYRNVASSERIRDAYRFLDEGVGVCQAYMLTMIALCNEVGIECLPVTSEEMNHAWNLVSVDGAWYHVDITWDDAGGESTAVYPSYISYDYFLLSGEALWASGREVKWDATRVAEDTRFDEALWRDASTPMIARDGFYYCTYYDEMMGAVICRGTSTDMDVIKILNGARWKSAEGVYQAAWASLVTWGDQLLFNTATGLCTYDPATGLVREIMDFSDTLEGKQIFGICDYTEEGDLTLVIAPDYKGTHELRSVALIP